MTNIDITAEPVTAQVAAALIQEAGTALPEPTDHKATVTSTRVLVEEYRTPIASNDTQFSRQIVAYNYEDDNTPPNSVQLLDSPSQLNLHAGKTYSKEELSAYVATLNSILARLI